MILEDMPVYFSTEEDMEVVQTIGSGREALFWLQYNSCDAVLSDVRMPDVDGIELLANIQNLPSPPVFVAMTAFDTDDALLRILAHGGSGYIIKGSKPAEIIAAVRTALEGRTSLSPELTTRLVDRSVLHHPSLTDNGRVALSPAEKEILSFIHAGLTNMQIAHRLGISEQSVKKRVSQLMRRFDADSRAHLVSLTQFRI